MIAFFNVLSDVVFLSVIALAVSLGGRYERTMALLHATYWVAAHLAQRLSQSHLPTSAYLAFDVGLLIGHLWLLRRTRPAWLLCSFGIQSLGMGLEAAQVLDLVPTTMVYQHVSAVLTYLQISCLAYAVLRRRIGPPLRERPAVSG